MLWGALVWLCLMPGGLSGQCGGMALSQSWLLSLLTVFLALGLFSVTSLVRNSRRQAEMGASVPGPCCFQSGEIWLTITTPLAWQASKCE